MIVGLLVVIIALLLIIAAAVINDDTITAIVFCLIALPILLAVGYGALLAAPTVITYLRDF